MLSWDTWLAIGMIAAPLIAKAASDISANAAANHNLALARITGMASRSAAQIALALSNLPAGSSQAATRDALISQARHAIATEMADSLKRVGAPDNAVGNILDGELAKLAVPVTAPPGSAFSRIPPAPLVPRASA